MKFGEQETEMPNRASVLILQLHASSNMNSSTFSALLACRIPRRVTLPDVLPKEVGVVLEERLRVRHIARKFLVCLVDDYTVQAVACVFIPAKHMQSLQCVGSIQLQMQLTRLWPADQSFETSQLNSDAESSSLLLRLT